MEIDYKRNPAAINVMLAAMTIKYRGVTWHGISKTLASQNLLKLACEDSGYNLE